MERPSRRRLLRGLGAATLAGAAGLAGCSGGRTEAGGADPTGTATESGGSGTNLSPPVRGDPEAEVTLAVYEDFACPHCKDYNENGYPALREYVDEGRIRYEHRDLPIPVLDPGSYEAASAARAVQDRHGDAAFWEYADALFANQDALRTETPALYADLAADLGYDGEPVRTAAVERAYDGTVTADRQRGIDAGLEGTPGFVVDGRAVTSGFGDATVEAVTAALDQALSAAGDGGSGY